jgi:hypothetical protein
MNVLIYFSDYYLSRTVHDEVWNCVRVLIKATAPSTCSFSGRSLGWYIHLPQQIDDLPDMTLVNVVRFSQHLCIHGSSRILLPHTNWISQFVFSYPPLIIPREKHPTGQMIKFRLRYRTVCSPAENRWPECGVVGHAVRQREIYNRQYEFWCYYPFWITYLTEVWCGNWFWHFSRDCKIGFRVIATP